jgi:hypothetical protein
MTRWRTPAVMLAAAATVLSIALGVRHGFGLFLQPMSLEFGWGREVFALAIALQNLVWDAAQPVTGMLADAVAVNLPIREEPARRLQAA